MDKQKKRPSNQEIHFHVEDEASGHLVRLCHAECPSASRMTASGLTKIGLRGQRIQYSI